MERTDDNGFDEAIGRGEPLPEAPMFRHTDPRAFHPLLAWADAWWADTLAKLNAARTLGELVMGAHLWQRGGWGHVEVGAMRCASDMRLATLAEARDPSALMVAAAVFDIDCVERQTPMFFLEDRRAFGGVLNTLCEAMVGHLSAASGGLFSKAFLPKRLTDYRIKISHGEVIVDQAGRRLSMWDQSKVVQEDGSQTFGGLDLRIAYGLMIFQPWSYTN